MARKQAGLGKPFLPMRASLMGVQIGKLTRLARAVQVQMVPANSTLLDQDATPMQREGSLLTSYLKKKDDPTTPTLLSEVEGGQLVFDSAVLFIDHWEGGSGGGWEGGRSGHWEGGSGGEWGGERHEGWGGRRRSWGYRYCSWGWGWCWGW